MEIETYSKQVAGRSIKLALPRNIGRDLFERKRLSPEERRAAGKALRDKVPRESKLPGAGSLPSIPKMP